MKKILTLSVLVFLTVSVVFALGKTEVLPENASIAVMQGPTGFSSAGLPDWIEVNVYPSPAEAVAGLVNGSLDMAVIPANKAAALYNSGMNIKAVATVGEGMLSIVGTNSESKTIYVPGPGDTPDLMASLLYPQYERDYSVTSPAQIAQLMIAGKIELAILPQPFVNKVLLSNKDTRIVSNVSEEWKKYTGESQYPMSVLVASPYFIEKNNALVKEIAKEYRNSVSWVIENPEEAGEKIEQAGIMAKDLAAISIKDCNLVYKDGAEFKEELKAYFDIIMDSVPDEGFFL